MSNVSNISKVSNTAALSSVVKPFYNRLNLPPKPVIVSNLPSKVQESPLDARSPQEVLDYHGMYKDPSYYESNPDKIYMDLTQFDSYETYLNKVNDFKDKFRNLPIDVQARFNHDPLEFGNYVSQKDFDITKLMDERTLMSYNAYKANEKARNDFEAYKNSAEYKKALSEASLRAQFEQSQFDAWKKQHADLSIGDNNITHT